MPRSITRRRRLRSIFGPALERVGGGLWRFADHRRQCGAGIEHHDQPDRTASRSAPIIASRRSRSQVLRWPAAAPISQSPTRWAADAPTCSRPAPIIRHTAGPAYISAALAYGWQDITTDRTVTVAGVDQLRAKFNANAFSGRAEGGYRFVAPWMGGIGITPYAAATVHHLRSAGLCRAGAVGANTFALAYGAKDVTATRSELGIRTDKSFAMQTAILTLRGRFAWAHDFDADRTIGATFQTLPGASFVVNGAAQAQTPRSSPLRPK